MEVHKYPDKYQNLKLVNKFLFPKVESANKSANKKPLNNKTAIQAKYNKKPIIEPPKYSFTDKSSRVPPTSKLKHEIVTKSNESQLANGYFSKNVTPTKDSNKQTKAKKVSNSVKEDYRAETEAPFFPKKSFQKQNLVKPILSIKSSNFKESKINITARPATQVVNEKNFGYLNTEDVFSNFSNYQKLTKNNNKRNTERINEYNNENSNNNSIMQSTFMKKNSLNMSFLNQFVERNLSPNFTGRRNVFNDSTDRNISSFSFQLSLKGQKGNTHLSNLKSESPVTGRIASPLITEQRESLLQIDEQYLRNVLMNSTGKVLNVDLINKIFSEMPELNHKKSSASTKEDTLRHFTSNNYQSKNVDVDTIEYLHFLFVRFFQKSKQITLTQENRKTPQKQISSDKTVIRVEEVDIE